MLFDDNEVKGSGYKVSYATRNKNKNDFVDSGGIKNHDVQELEHYAGYDIEQARYSKKPMNMSANIITSSMTYPIQRRSTGTFATHSRLVGPTITTYRVMALSRWNQVASRYFVDPEASESTITKAKIRKQINMISIATLQIIKNTPWDSKGDG